MEKNYWQVVPEEMIQLRDLRNTLFKAKKDEENSDSMVDESQTIVDSYIVSESIISQDDDDSEVKMDLDMERFHAAFGCMLAEVQGGERDDESDTKPSTTLDELLNGLFE